MKRTKKNKKRAAARKMSGGGKPEFCFANGEMPLKEYLEMLEVFNESELSKHGSISMKNIDGDSDVAVEIKVKRHAEFLLKSSLEDGMLREFGKFFPQCK